MSGFAAGDQQPRCPSQSGPVPVPCCLNVPAYYHVTTLQTTRATHATVSFTIWKYARNGRTTPSDWLPVNLENTGHVRNTKAKIRVPARCDATAAGTSSKRASSKAIPNLGFDITTFFTTCKGSKTSGNLILNLQKRPLPKFVVGKGSVYLLNSRQRADAIKMHIENSLFSRKLAYRYCFISKKTQ
jgi:hypothetical protein